MSYKYVIDSYAWIEYFRGTSAGAKARKYIEEEESATPTIVIAELSRKLLKEVEAGRETPEGREARLRFIKISTIIVNLTEEIATLAGEIDVERKRKVKEWGLADSIVLATARKSKAKVVTGDEHFRDLADEVILIK